MQVYGLLSFQKLRFIAALSVARNFKYSLYNFRKFKQK